MFSVSDFESKYINYSDEELIHIKSNIDGYSIEAQQALENVIGKKGGIERILEKINSKKIIENEILRIKKEAKDFGSKGIDSSFIKNTTSSKILSDDAVNDIIDSEFVQVEYDLEDQKIKPRTILGSVVGGIIASVVGGALWGMQMIYSNRIFYVFGFGLAFLCYGILKVSTGQSKNNKVVLIATVISAVLALIIGQILYEIIGYRE